MSKITVNFKTTTATITCLFLVSCFEQSSDSKRISREKTYTTDNAKTKNTDAVKNSIDIENNSEETGEILEKTAPEEEKEIEIPVNKVEDISDSIENENDLPSNTLQEIDPQVWKHPNTDGYKLTALQLYLPNKYFHESTLNLHFFATKGTNQEKFDATVSVFKKAIESLRPENKEMFSGHHIFLITFNDPDVPGTSLAGHKNTGGNGFVIITEELICADSTYDTIRPDAELTDTVWRTPLHELGHSIELTLGISDKTSELLKLNHPNGPSDVELREKFAWLTESWFNQGLYTNRNNMQEWEKLYFEEVFSNQVFDPSCSF